MYHACYLLEILLLAAILLLALRGGGARQLAPFDKERTLPIRGLLALFVVIGHCDTKVPGSSILNALHMSTPAVAAFFFLSGYGLVKSLARGREGYFDGFLRRSFVKLAIPVVVAAVVMCVCLKLEGRSIGLPGRIVNLVTRGRNFPQHSWFVYALAVHYALFFVSFRWLPAKKALALFVALSVCYNLAVRLGHWPFVWYRTSLCMSVGAAWSLYEDRIKAAVSRRGTAVLAGMLAAILAWHVASKLNTPLSRFLARDAKELAYLLMGPTLALVMYVVHGVPRVVASCFGFLGAISFEIYLLHFVGERNIARLGLGGLPSCAVVVLAVVPMAYAAHKFDSWAIGRATRLVAGRRGGAR